MRYGEFWTVEHLLRIVELRTGLGVMYGSKTGHGIIPFVFEQGSGPSHFWDDQADRVLNGVASRSYEERNSFMNIK